MLSKVPISSRQQLNTTALTQTFEDAARWTVICRAQKVTSLHLLLALVHTADSIAQAALVDGGISKTNVWAAIDYWDPQKSDGRQAPKLARFRRAPRWKSTTLRVATGSQSEAERRGGTQTDTGDLLVALLQEPNSRAARILDRAHLDPESLRQLVKLARGEIDEGRATFVPPDFTNRRPVRPQWGPANAR